MSQKLDMGLIAAVIDRQISRVEGLGNPERLARASGVSRATIYRILNRDERVSQRTLERLERHLELPYDSLLAVGLHDFATLGEIGVDPQLVSWIHTKAMISSENAAGKAVGT